MTIEDAMDIMFKQNKMMFKELADKAPSIKWARDNYVPFSEINGTWHPVVQEECVKINLEHSHFVPVPDWMAKEND